MCVCVCVVYLVCKYTIHTHTGPVAGAELGVDLRYSVYLLYWYNLTNTDVIPRISHNSKRVAEARMKAGKKASMRSGWQVVMMHADVC